MVKRKLATIESAGKISALGGLNGPFMTPKYYDIDILISLVNANKIVYEVNPYNRKEKIRLTRQNILADNFAQSVKKDTTKIINKPSINLSTKPTNTNRNISNIQPAFQIGFCDEFVLNNKS